MKKIIAFILLLGLLFSTPKMLKELFPFNMNQQIGWNSYVFRHEFTTITVVILIILLALKLNFKNLNKL